MTDGIVNGYAWKTYKTRPEGFEVVFDVSPSQGTAYSTLFALSVVQKQFTHESFSFTFGYLDPQDSTKHVNIGPLSRRPTRSTILPSASSGEITVFVVASSPSGLKKTRYSTVAVSLSSSAFNAGAFVDWLDYQVFDTVFQSLQAAIKFSYLAGRDDLTDSEIGLAGDKLA